MHRPRFREGTLVFFFFSGGRREAPRGYSPASARGPLPPVPEKCFTANCSGCLKGTAASSPLLPLRGPGLFARRVRQSCGACGRKGRAHRGSTKTVLDSTPFRYSAAACGLAAGCACPHLLERLSAGRLQLAADSAQHSCFSAARAQLRTRRLPSPFARGGSCLRKGVYELAYIILDRSL
jgi:hypothetical protein